MAGKKEISFEEAAEYPFILLEKGYTHMRAFQNLSEKSKKKPEVPFYFSDVPTIGQLVSSNIGMRAEMINQYDGFGTDAYCNALYEKYSYTEQVRFVPFAPEVRTGYELGWIQRRNQPRSGLANELYALLQE